MRHRSSMGVNPGAGGSRRPYFGIGVVGGNHNRKRRKLLICRAPTKAKSQEPAYSQTLNQNKIDRQGSRFRESGRQLVRRLWWMVLGVETGREVWGRR